MHNSGCRLLASMLHPLIQEEQIRRFSCWRFYVHKWPTNSDGVCAPTSFDRCKEWHSTLVPIVTAWFIWYPINVWRSYLLCPSNEKNRQWLCLLKFSTESALLSLKSRILGVPLNLLRTLGMIGGLNSSHHCGLLIVVHTVSALHDQVPCDFKDFMDSEDNAKEFPST